MSHILRLYLPGSEGYPLPEQLTVRVSSSLQYQYADVDIPPTLALFGLGLAGLGWTRRKKAVTRATPDRTLSIRPDISIPVRKSSSEERGQPGLYSY
jgi:hypothetical protein